MTRDFEGSQVGATPIEEVVPQKKRTNKAFDDAERHPATTLRPGDFAPVPRPYARLHGKSPVAFLVFYLARAKNRPRALQSG